MMTKKQRKRQKKLEAKFQSEINAKKSAAIQAKTGNVVLNSSFWLIQNTLKKSQYRYGYVINLNIAA